MGCWRAVIVCFGVLILNQASLHAEEYYQFDGGFRSFARGTSVQGQYFYNKKFWSLESEEQPWLYGLWRFGASAATHGQVGARLDFYPISIFQLSLQKSFTQRFYEIETLACDKVDCAGMVDRTTLKVSSALGVKDFFLLPSYEVTFLTHKNATKVFASEDDNLLAHRQGDQLNKWQIALGLSRGIRKYIVVHQQSSMEKTGDQSRSTYFIYNHQWKEGWASFVGGGFFESTHATQTPSLVAGLQLTRGDKLTLF